MPSLDGHRDFLTQSPAFFARRTPAELVGMSTAEVDAMDALFEAAFFATGTVFGNALSSIGLEKVKDFSPQPAASLRP